MPETLNDSNKRALPEVNSELESTETPVKKVKLNDKDEAKPSEETDKFITENDTANEEANSVERPKNIETAETTETAVTKEEDTNNKKEEEAKEKDEGAKAEIEGKKTEPKPEKDVEKPSFTFGQSSSFVSGFGVATKPFGAANAFSAGLPAAKTTEKDGNKDTVKVEPGFSFGSGLSFGAGFKAAKVASKDSVAKDKQTVESEKKESTPAQSREPTVKLTKQDVKSGEETEESIFQTNAKLYQLTDIKDGWKERGIGVLHLNKDEVSEKSRIVMRSRGLLKVILNLPLVKGFSIKKGFPGSLNGEKFVRILAVDENKNPVQYALRTGKAEIADELYEKVNDHILEN